jgi:hypothetical protein
MRRNIHALTGVLLCKSDCFSPQKPEAFQGWMPVTSLWEVTEQGQYNGPVNVTHQLKFFSETCSWIAGNASLH